MSASRSGFITLVARAGYWMWHFGVKRRRFYLLVASGLATLTLLGVAAVKGPLF